MAQQRLLDLPDILRGAGLRVVEVPGWRELSRPESTGGFRPRGNAWHHTGAKDTNPLSIKDDYEYAEWLAHIGRSDLPAPLCQLSPARNGTIFVCAAGRGNHAGQAKAFGTLPAGDGNEMYLGWECQNTGSEGWSGPQYEAMVKGGAAVAKAYGWDVRNNPGHKEISLTGKWDPGQLNMAEFRDDIEDQMLAQDDVIREHLVAGIRALRLAKQTSKDPIRPKIVHQVDEALKHTRAARDLTKG